MTKPDVRLSRGELKALLLSDEDGFRRVLQTVVQEALEAEMTEAITFQALYRAHAMDAAFGQRTVGDRIGFMRRHEGDLGARQPEQAHDEQHRHGRQRQQPETPASRARS